MEYNRGIYEREERGIRVLEARFPRKLEFLDGKGFRRDIEIRVSKSNGILRCRETLRRKFRKFWSFSIGFRRGGEGFF